MPTRDLWRKKTSVLSRKKKHSLSSHPRRQQTTKAERSEWKVDGDDEVVDLAKKIVFDKRGRLCAPLRYCRENGRTTERQERLLELTSVVAHVKVGKECEGLTLTIWWKSTYYSEESILRCCDVITYASGLLSDQVGSWGFCGTRTKGGWSLQEWEFSAYHCLKWVLVRV